MRALLIFFMAWISLTTVAQDRNFYERLHGTNLKGKLLLKVTSDSTLVYRSDDTGWYSVKDKLFNSANYNHDNSVNLYMAFSNPFRRVITFEHKEETDVTLAVVDDFFKQSSDQVQSLGEKSTLQEFFLGSAQTQGPQLDQLPSVHLAHWWFNMQKYIKDSKGLCEKLRPILEVERFLYGTIDLGEAKSGTTNEGRVYEILQGKADEIRGAEGYDEFRGAFEVAESTVRILQGKLATHKGQVQELQGLLTNQFYDRVMVEMKDEAKKDTMLIRQYTELTAIRELGEISNKLSAVESRIDDLKKLAEEARNYAKSFSKDNAFGEEGYYRKIKSDSFKYDRKTASRYAFTIKSADGSSRKTEFSVAKRLTLVPFASTGLTYTNFRYPEYSLSDSDTARVVNEVDTDPSLKISAFLNLAFPMRYAGVYPYLQLGLSVGETDMVLPIGAGFILFDKISLSAGTMLGYHNDLKTLSAGDVATQDQFDADIRKNVFGFNNWYFSVNYTLGK